MNLAGIGRTKAVQVLAPLLLALPLAACGGSSSGAPHNTSTHTLKGRVLTEVIAGGFVPAEEAFLEGLPVVTVYADGRIFSVNQSGNSQPVLVRLSVRTVPRATLEGIVNLAQAAGVTKHPPDFGHPGVTDLPTTAFTLSADGTSSSIDVYADGFTGGLTSTQVGARKRLDAFASQLEQLATVARQGSQLRPYLPTSLSVYMGPFATPPPASSPPLRFPSGVGVTHGSFDCVGILGAANVTRILPLAERATVTTVWIVGDYRGQLVFRPDLPDAKPCSSEP